MKDVVTDLKDQRKMKLKMNQSETDLFKELMKVIPDETSRKKINLTKSTDATTIADELHNSMDDSD